MSLRERVHSFLSYQGSEFQREGSLPPSSLGSEVRIQGKGSQVELGFYHVLF